MRPFQVPDAQWAQIKACHNGRVGHGGVEATLRKLAKQGLNKQPHMRAYVRQFIKKCDCCQKLRDHKFKAITERFTLGGGNGLMLRIYIDTIGPFPKDEEGNEYIIVVIDCFSRFVELHAAKSADAESAARAIISQIGRYGPPQQIVTDGGSQYDNDLVNALVSHVGCEKITTHPYSSEENGLVERANKEVVRFLRGLMYDEPEIREKLNLSVHLPVVMRIMNTNYQSRLGCSPVDIVFGGQLDFEPGMFLPEEEKAAGSVDIPVSEYMQKVQAVQQVLMERAEGLQAKHDKEQAELSVKETRTQYAVGDWVYVEDGRKDKFAMNRKGPFKVSAVLDNDMYFVDDTNCGKEVDYHVKRLSPAEVDEERYDPEELARRGEKLWVIEKILSHKGDFQAKRNLRFKVKWLGFKDPTWELWKDVCNSAKLHSYLVAKKLARWIPAKFKD
jgi:transposase InsO family protein